MNTMQEIPQGDLDNFKEEVKTWIQLDNEIQEYEKKIKELKKKRNKELEPSITTFMVTHNISDLNTGGGKIKCTPRNTKQTLNKVYIEENLKKVIQDDNVIQQAMNNILNNREIKTTYKLQIKK
jgi:hypothetical protein